VKIFPEKTWALQQLVYAEVLRRLDEHFAELNIRYMPIKGAYLIAGGLAEKMPFRRMDDLDILILPADFTRASDYFRNSDCVRMSENYWPFETSFFYTLGRDSIYVELHHQLNFPQRFNLPTADLFARAQQAGPHRSLPCAEDALLVCICHVLVHIAVELRETVCEEISLLSRQGDFSWERFWKLSSGTGIERFIGCIISWYAEHSGIPVPVPRSFALNRLFSQLLKPRPYGLMPVLLRKLLLEIPFVRDPAWLIRHKSVQNVKQLLQKFKRRVLIAQR
jgi:hypothetical protein